MLILIQWNIAKYVMQSILSEIKLFVAKCKSRIYVYSTVSQYLIICM